MGSPANKKVRIGAESPELENVNIKLRGWFGNMDWIYRKKYYRLLTDMLSGLGNARNLTFDSDGIEALSSADFLASLPSPFYNLKIVKLPLGYKESSIFGALRSYILGGSPRATIVTTLPQSNMLSQTEAVSMTTQNEVILKPLAAPTKELDDSQFKHQIPIIEENVVEDFVVDTDRVRRIDVPVEIGKDRVSSSRENRDFGLWRGHEVNSAFVCLLNCIMDKYPETFEQFTAKNKKLCTRNLNMLCTSLNDFTKLSITEVDSETIVEYRELFAYLNNRGFNVSWAVSRLNYIEHLRFSKPLITELHEIDCRIDEDKTKLQELQARVDDVKSKLQDLEAHVDDAKSKLRDLQTLRLEKLTEIEKSFGTMGTNLSVGSIGADLLSSA
ncbi:hypothetical protein POM88_002680 [Heracleum sosnowskyi]|uniref:Uncharacterized protein n=1 Tax=Heracleum sosnowskyi TaxID=360622 RepID=A0AAD8JIX0_9APIA|nr:hypothetical protein POM88_002680 [Heracleum sosnowskyi]